MKNSQVQQQYLLDGRKEAKKIIKALKHKSIKARNKISLAVILVGNDPASKLYISIKEKKARELGINFKKYILPASTSEKKIINLIQKLNRDKKITGLMVQLPLPKKFKTNKIINTIDPKKDVDGLQFKTQNTNNLPTGKAGKTQGKNIIIPPTLQSILHLIKISRQKLAGKKAVILCNSQEFGTPLKNLLEKEKMRVKIILNPQKSCATRYMLHVTLVIIALGQRHWLKPAMINKNAILIDVGINKAGKMIYGDVDPACLKKTPYISPVPGGVGPLTVAYLMKNLINLAK